MQGIELKLISLNFPPELKNKIRAVANRKGISFSAAVRIICQDGLPRFEQKMSDGGASKTATA